MTQLENLQDAQKVVEKAVKDLEKVVKDFIPENAGMRSIFQYPLQVVGECKQLLDREVRRLLGQ